MIDTYLVSLLVATCSAPLFVSRTYRYWHLFDVLTVLINAFFSQDRALMNDATWSPIVTDIAGCSTKHVPIMTDSR